MNEPAYATFLNSLTATPIEANSNIKMETAEGGTMPNSEDTAARKPWMKRPGAPVVKVGSDVKRRRRNYQARKLLIPKNPLMILNELVPNVSFTYEENVEQAYFDACVELDGQMYFGKGSSKQKAAQDCAEVALRGFYFEKLLAQLKSPDDVDMKDVAQPTDGQADGAAPKLFSHPEDETPWALLASLAMYKLVNLWQSTPSPNGAQVSAVPKPLGPSGSELVAKLPPNAADLDPVMVLNQMSPQSKFVEESRDVRNGSIMFTLAVIFNGAKFTGTASKKKVAKKMCAKEALESIGVVFDDTNVHVQFC